MTISEHLPLADVKNRLSEVIDTLEREHGRVLVAKHGRPAAVMMNLDDLESLEEALAIWSNPALKAAVRAGDDDLAESRAECLSRDEILALGRTPGPGQRLSMIPKRNVADRHRNVPAATISVLI